MNIKLLIPRRKHALYLSSIRRNPGWLKRAARWVGHQRRLISLYYFHLRLGCTHAEAWDKAGRTL